MDYSYNALNGIKCSKSFFGHVFSKAFLIYSVPVDSNKLILLPKMSKNQNLVIPVERSIFIDYS